MNKIVIAIVAVAIITVGGYFLLRSLRYQAPSSNLAPQSTSQGTIPTTPALTTPAPTTQETPSAEKNVVIYTDAGYSPSTLNIKAGATVTFKNNSSQSMRTASGVHPTHRLYPTTGGCIGSTFDACKGVQPGGSWSFKFDIAGTWKYHNHLNPSDTGTIIVEQ